MTHPKTQREVIGARLRYDILRRCNFACYYCGIPASMGVKQLHVDHVIPVSLGGTNDPWNLVAACWDCNAGKANLPPSRDVVRRTRSEWRDYETSRGKEVHTCDFCGIPVELIEDEEWYGDCLTCNRLKMDSYEHGLVQAFQNPVLGEQQLRSMERQGLA